MGLLVGCKAFLLVHLPLMALTASIGVWLFYVQHQFEPTYWEHDEGWSYDAAALEGSSHYELPRLLQWLTGNIGLHHVHHLNARIPNYRLQRALEEVPELQTGHPHHALAEHPLRVAGPVGRTHAHAGPVPPDERLRAKRAKG